MQELASFSVLANSFFMELRAQLGHKVVWEMSLPLKLVSTMGIRASITEFAVSIHFKVSAEFGLFLGFVVLLENMTFFGCLEKSLFGTSGGFAVFTHVLVHEQVHVAALINFMIVMAIVMTIVITAA